MMPRWDQHEPETIKQWGAQYMKISRCITFWWSPSVVIRYPSETEPPRQTTNSTNKIRQSGVQCEVEGMLNQVQHARGPAQINGFVEPWDGFRMSICDGNVTGLVKKQVIAHVGIFVSTVANGDEGSLMPIILTSRALFGNSPSIWNKWYSLKVMTCCEGNAERRISTPGRLEYTCLGFRCVCCFFVHGCFVGCRSVGRLNDLWVGCCWMWLFPTWYHGWNPVFAILIFPPKYKILLAVYSYVPVKRRAGRSGDCWIPCVFRRP